MNIYPREPANQVNYCLEEFPVWVRVMVIEALDHNLSSREIECRVRNIASSDLNREDLVNVIIQLFNYIRLTS